MEKEMINKMGMYVICHLYLSSRRWRESIGESDPEWNWFCCGKRVFDKYNSVLIPKETQLIHGCSGYIYKVKEELNVFLFSDQFNINKLSSFDKTRQLKIKSSHLKKGLRKDDVILSSKGCSKHLDYNSVNKIYPFIESLGYDGYTYQYTCGESGLVEIALCINSDKLIKVKDVHKSLGSSYNKICYLKNGKRIDALSFSKINWKEIKKQYPNFPSPSELESYIERYNPSVVMEVICKYISMYVENKVKK